MNEGIHACQWHAAAMLCSLADFLVLSGNWHPGPDLSSSDTFWLAQQLALCEAKRQWRLVTFALRKRSSSVNICKQNTLRIATYCNIVAILFPCNTVMRCSTPTISSKQALELLTFAVPLAPSKLWLWLFGNCLRLCTVHLPWRSGVQSAKRASLWKLGLRPGDT